MTNWVLPPGGDGTAATPRGAPRHTADSPTRKLPNIARRHTLRNGTRPFFATTGATPSPPPDGGLPLERDHRPLRDARPSSPDAPAKRAPAPGPVGARPEFTDLDISFLSCHNFPFFALSVSTTSLHLAVSELKTDKIRQQCPPGASMQKKSLFFFIGGGFEFAHWRRMCILVASRKETRESLLTSTARRQQA